MRLIESLHPTQIILDWMMDQNPHLTGWPFRWHCRGLCQAVLGSPETEVDRDHSTHPALHDFAATKPLLAGPQSVAHRRMHNPFGDYICSGAVWHDTSAATSCKRWKGLLFLRRWWQHHFFPQKRAGRWTFCCSYCLFYQIINDRADSSFKFSSFKFYLSHTRLYRDCITSSEMRVGSAPWTVQILKKQHKGSKHKIRWMKNKI